MDLNVEFDGHRDRAAVLYEALREAVRRGRLAAGTRLPASRALAADLAVSRGTVSLVYERLVAEGYLESRVGAGTFVSAVGGEPRSRHTSALRPRKGWRWTPQPVSADGPAPTYDFRVGTPDAGLFPFDTWRRILTAESRLHEHDPGLYAAPAGLPRLRKAIAEHLGQARGLHTDADEVVVTQGAQQGLDLLARILLEPGAVVAVEDPGYPVARDLFASHGARIAPVPVDDEGLVVAQIPAQARLVYTTPSHQFPLGTTMSLARRRELLAHAARHRAAVIEDDYDSEFRFEPRPLETLHCLDDSGHVVYLGTFSKSLLPTLRLGYLLCPPSLREAVLGARQLSDGFGPLHLQAALARFIEEGLLARHVRRAAKVYGERRAILLDELGRTPLEALPPAAGLHLAATVDDDLAAGLDRVVERAAASGIAVATVRSHGEHPRDGLLFGYGSAVTESIRPGIRRLARLLRDAGPPAASGPTRPGRARRSPASR